MEFSLLNIVIMGVIALISAILGAGGITPIIIAVLNNRRTMSTDAQDYAQDNFDRMEKRIDKLEQLEEKCREDKEELIIKITSLEAENALMKREIEKLRSDVENYRRNANTTSLCARIIANKDGNIIEWSKGAVELFGFYEYEVMGRSIQLLMPYNQREKHNEAFEKAVAEDKILKNVRMSDVFARTKNGSLKAISIILNTRLRNDEKVYEAEIQEINST